MRRMGLGYGAADLARPEMGRSPLADTRAYQQGNANTEPVARHDLRFNPRTLSPLQEVPRDQLSYVADTMRYGDFGHIPFSVAVLANAEPILSRPQTKRTFLLIQNTHSAQTLFVGFGVQPSAGIGIPIAAGGSLILDACVAQNDVFLSGSGAATTGMLTYCNQAFGQA
jgi:hypothetical protein